MKLKIFLLFCVFGRHCSAASIGEGLTVVEEVEPVGESGLLYEAADPVTVDVLETQPLIETRAVLEEVPEDVIRLEPEEPGIVPAVVSGLPYEASGVQEGHIALAVSAATTEENGKGPADVIDEVAAERAEREADVDLLRALDSVLAREETLEDVIKSEDISLE